MNENPRVTTYVKIKQKMNSLAYRINSLMPNLAYYVIE